MRTNPETSAQTALIAPKIGLGNLTEIKALAHILNCENHAAQTHIPTGPLIMLAKMLHIHMSADIKNAIKYSNSSSSQRDSTQAELLKLELLFHIKHVLKQHPKTNLILSAQDMTAATAFENITEIPTGIVAPDAMGKLLRGQNLSDTQREIPYLVWNENAYKYMTQILGVTNVQLIDLIDPLLAFEQLNKEQIKNLGFPELDEANQCLIKLSGSGGDDKFINTIITALYKNSGTLSVVFPGIAKTGNKIINRVKRKGGIIKQSLDEGWFYNVARQSSIEMMLFNPSEQLKHIMVLSQHKQVNVVWLPPRGQHEVNNLAEYIFLAKTQNLQTTICLPKKYWTNLAGKLANFELAFNQEFIFVEPTKITREHFQPAPNWNEELEKSKILRVPHKQAVQNLINGHQK